MPQGDRSTRSGRQSTAPGAGVQGLEQRVASLEKRLELLEDKVFQRIRTITISSSPEEEEEEEEQEEERQVKEEDKGGKRG